MMAVIHFGHLPSLVDWDRVRQADTLYLKDVSWIEDDYIIKLFDHHNIDYKSKHFIFDHYLFFDGFESYHVDAKNHFFTRYCKEHVEVLPDWNTIPDYEITHACNFMSKKSRDHRTLSAVLLANYFAENEIKYTWHGNTNFNNLAEKYLKDYDIQYDKVLTDRQLCPYNDIRELAHMTDLPSFKKEIFSRVFENTAVSIITEPAFLEPGPGITEKTLYALYSGTFMIWAGAMKSAEAVEKIGFDVFHDVIDHSYQYIKDPGQRVAECVLRNMNVLRSLDLQTELRHTHRKRLQNNLNLCRDIDQLISNIKQLGDKT